MVVVCWFQVRATLEAFLFLVMNFPVSDNFPMNDEGKRKITNSETFLLYSHEGMIIKVSYVLRTLDSIAVLPLWHSMLVMGLCFTISRFVLAQEFNKSGNQCSVTVDNGMNC